MKVLASVTLLVWVLALLLFQRSQKPIRPPGRVQARGLIIHLPDRRDRAGNVAALQAAAGAAEIEIGVLSAVDARDCADLPVPTFLDFSRGVEQRSHLRGGEQGCLASHFQLFLQLGARQGPVLMLEDDAIVGPDQFRAMLQRLQQEAGSRSVHHGRRSMPGGWPQVESLHDSERAAAERGWFPLRAPNYSTAFFGMTGAALQGLLRWLALISRHRRHLMPADDLLSAACGVHPSTQAWEEGHELRGWASLAPLNGRLASLSDTEHRRPAVPGKTCVELNVQFA